MKNLLFAGLMLFNTSVLMAAAPVELIAESNQFHFLQGIGEVAPAVNVEAYERELKYLHQGLSLDEKVKNEANILASAIRTQVVNAYEVELREVNGDVSLAYENVRSMITQDLKLADEEMKEDLLKIAEHALNTLTLAPRSETIDVTKLEEVLRKDIQKREAYLTGSSLIESSVMRRSGEVNTDLPFQNFASKQAVVDALVTKEQNTRWIRTATTSFKSGQTVSKAASISLQVKIEFLGVSVEAGPRISFKRDFSTNVNILADGLDPIIDNDGKFDYFERDQKGKATKDRRFIAFFCDANMNFKTDHEGKGGFKVAGIGGDSSVSKEYSNQVTLNSRRLYVPETIGNRVVSLSYLAEICHNDFLNAKINAKTTVRSSLEVMMTNIISGIRFSHPETKCALDNHCLQWFNNQVLPIARVKAVPRCIANKEGAYSCTLRGAKGQTCAVVENGKRTSGGLGEYICNTGLSCVKTRDAGWLQGGQLYQPSAGVCK